MVVRQSRSWHVASAVLPCLLLAACVVPFGCAGLRPPVAPVPAPGALVGVVARPDGSASDPLVVYLGPIESEGESEDGPPGAAAREMATIESRDGTFEPAFLAVAVGQPVRFAGGDDVLHRIFSYAEGNRFELETLSAEASQDVALRRPGVVRFYCSLHSWESGTIFVAPSPWFDVVGPQGHFEIADVPPGRYRVRAWAPGAVEAERDVLVRGGQPTSIELGVASEGPPAP